jgi:hypothetical protein
MSQGTETFIRTLGGIIAAAIISAALGFLATASNLTVLGSYAPIIATVAASLLAVWDKAYSQNGQVLFGAIGKARLS